MPPRATVTERTFYPGLLEIISEHGGSGVSEVQYNSVPDIEFEYSGQRWLLSVKIGETPKIIKDAFLQYLRHKEESGLTHGLLVMLPERFRKVAANHAALRRALDERHTTVLVDAGPIKEEYRDRTFATVLDTISSDIAAALRRGEARYFSLSLVLDFLRVQVVEVMETIQAGEERLLEIITDRSLLADLARLNREADRDDAAKEVGAWWAGMRSGAYGLLVLNLLA